MTNENEVLTRLHSVRKTLLEESGGTLTGLSNRLREEESSSGRKIVTNAKGDPTFSDASGAESA